MPVKRSNNKGVVDTMSIARIRARFASTSQRKLYNSIHAVASRSQRDELLVMAQRAERI